MTLAECRHICSDSNVKVEEKQRSAVFKNEAREEYLRRRVDGCLIKNQLACDWAVSKAGIGDILIELKGIDVDHATRQILAVAQYWKDNALNQGSLAGLIVCKQYPRIDTTIQRAKQQMARSYKAPLHVVSRNTTYDFDKVLSFKGPL